MLCQTIRINPGLNLRKWPIYSMRYIGNGTMTRIAMLSESSMRMKPRRGFMALTLKQTRVSGTFIHLETKIML